MINGHLIFFIAEGLLGAKRSYIKVQIHKGKNIHVPINLAVLLI